jgi:hypothetical protein
MGFPWSQDPHSGCNLYKFSFIHSIDLIPKQPEGHERSARLILDSDITSRDRSQSCQCFLGVAMECELQRNINDFILWTPLHGPPVPGNTLGVRHVDVFLPYSQDVSAGIRGEYVAAPYSSRIPKTSRIIRRPYTVSFCGGIRISAAFLGDSQVLKVRRLIALRYCVGHSSTKAILVALYLNVSSK